ncbi:MAG TPA: NAD(+)/NADH kinase [Anaerolineaceae bacterium]
MFTNNAIPRRFAVAAHPSIPEAISEAEEISRFLLAQGAESAVTAIIQDRSLRQRVQACEFDLLIALGGDGTMLRAGNLCAPAGIPVLGINLGRFGFLTEVSRTEWRTALPRVLSGDFRLEERMMLRAVHRRGEAVLSCLTYLNEAVVCRGKSVRPIQVTARVDGSLLTTYVADGLIAATPTGSTAYALACGGPIMPPELRNILICPIAPHLSVDRAIILSEGVQVELVVHTDHEAVISVDGRPPIDLVDGDTVSVSIAECAARFARLRPQGYFYANITAYMEQHPSTGKRS